MPVASGEPEIRSPAALGEGPLRKLKDAGSIPATSTDDYTAKVLVGAPFARGSDRARTNQDGKARATAANTGVIRSLWVRNGASEGVWLSRFGAGVRLDAAVPATPPCASQRPQAAGSADNADRNLLIPRLIRVLAVPRGILSMMLISWPLWP